MINADTFKGKISPKKEKFGSTLAIIHQGLIRYDALINATAQERISLLYSILKYVRRYNKAHEDREGYGVLSGKSAELHTRRKVACSDLADDLEAEMQRLDPDIAGALTRHNARKAQRPDAANTPHRGLAAGYANERTSYESNKKLRDEALKKKNFYSPASTFRAPNPFAASHIRDGAGDLHVKYKSKKLAAFVNQMKNEPGLFGAMTNKQFEDIGFEIRARQVQFFTKVERMEYSIHLGDDRLFYDVRNMLIDHVTQVLDPIWNRMKPFQHIYAMDHYGNLYCRDEAPEEQNEAGGYINHSSFAAGRAVICAGCITIKQGRLVHIDNNSGHYQPTADDLRNALQVLYEDGVDLTRTRALIKDRNGIISTTANALLQGQERVVAYPDAWARQYGI